MERLILFCLICVLFISCDDQTQTDCSCTTVDRGVDIILKDVEGNFLINQQVFNHLQILYLNDESVVLGETPIYIDEFGIKAVRIFLNNDSSEEYPITYVRWNESDTDTIKAKFTKNKQVIERYWINEVEVTELDEFGFYTLLK